MPTTHPALSVHCRECGAVPGERCQSEHGAVKPRSYAHYYRRADFGAGTDPGPGQSYQAQKQSRIADLISGALADGASGAPNSQLAPDQAASEPLTARILATPLTESHTALLLLLDQHADEVARVLDRIDELTGGQR